MLQRGDSLVGLFSIIGSIAITTLHFVVTTPATLVGFVAFVVRNGGIVIVIAHTLVVVR
jgi:hypothetical protein